MDSRDEYDYGWNLKGQRFHTLKSGRHQGRLNKHSQSGDYQIISFVNFMYFRYFYPIL